MNPLLQQIFSKWYHPTTTDNKISGASSQAGTVVLRKQMLDLFERHHIKSVFDAGCNDCNWMEIISKTVDYCGGDISAAMVNDVKTNYPNLKVFVHDITSDPVPDVDLLFVRDVAIHFNNNHKLAVWQNWYCSNVEWIMITHCPDQTINQDFQYQDDQFPFASANWQIDPWNFPSPIDAAYEYNPEGRCMALWNRNQFQGIL